MSKGLEALKTLMNNVLRNDDKLCNKCVSIIEKELKALEIIKYQIKVYDVYINENIKIYVLVNTKGENIGGVSEEEYKLLKEIL